MKKHFTKSIAILLTAVLALSVFLPAVFAQDTPLDGERVEYNGHTYIRMDVSMTWKEAKEYCELNGGYLATVTDLAEKTVVERLISNGKKEQYWLGATDEEKEGTWKWITGEGRRCATPMSR